MLAALLLVFVLRLIAALALIPPWQGPDEPQHLLLVSILVNGSERSEAVEADIVASMYRSAWWEYYQRPRPQVVPSTFRAGPALVTDVDGIPGGPRLAHEGVASALRTLNVHDVESQYWILRASAGVCALLTLVIAWYANRAAFGPQVATASVAMMALHPQYLLVALTANPDAAVLVLGAMFWAAIAYAFRGGAAAAVVVAGAAALLAALIRRVAFPLLVDFAVVVLFFTVRARRRRRTAVWAAGSVVVVAVLSALQAPERVEAALEWSMGAVNARGALEVLTSDPGFGLTLAKGLFQSFWLTAGWARFPAPGAWYVLVGLLCATAVWGCVRLASHLPPGSRLRHALGIACVLVLLQVVAVFVMHLPIRTGAQGRYLMPVAVPIFAILATGLLHASSTLSLGGWRSLAFLTAVFASIDALGWALVLFPVYSPG